MTQPTTVEQVANQALERIGYPEYIGNIFEGTKQARVCLGEYQQVRSSLLRMSNWGFAKQIKAAVLSGNPAPAPWTVEYAYPTLCIRVLSLFNSTYTGNPNNPLPVLWTIGNSSTSGNEVIWCNEVGATVVFTGDVANPAQWEPLFTEQVIEQLARRIAPLLERAEMMAPISEEQKIVLPMAMEELG